MLSNDIDRHIELRRALGFKYRVQASLLRSYARFAEERGDEVVRILTVTDWAGQACSIAQRRNRLLTVRRLAKELHAEDTRHEIPPAGLFGRRCYERRIPHIYTQDELSLLFTATAQLKPRDSLRPITYSTLFALLATVGLRVSEALALSGNDICDDGLSIRATKFRKSRLVPIHQTTQRALQCYLAHRLRPPTVDSHVFVGLGGHALSYSTVCTVFLCVARQCGLRGAPGQGGPRLHDLRHSFAVKALEQCIEYEGGVAQHILALSTFLGHAHVSDTYWYLQATPTLMRQVANASEALHEEKPL